MARIHEHWLNPVVQTPPVELIGRARRVKRQRRDPIERTGLAGPGIAAVAGTLNPVRQDPRKAT